ncbi:MAG: hypothetical protein QM655_15800 [Nocardioidaceae bacterium]
MPSRARRIFRSQGYDGEPSTYQATVATLAPRPHLGVNEAVAYAVRGTALYEPLILALRRLVRHHLLTQRRQPRR